MSKVRRYRQEGRQLLTGAVGTLTIAAAAIALGDTTVFALAYIAGAGCLIAGLESFRRANALKKL